MSRYFPEISCTGRDCYPGCIAHGLVFLKKFLHAYKYRIGIEWWGFALTGALAPGIALVTVSDQSIKASLMNPVKSLRSE